MTWVKLSELFPTLKKSKSPTFQALSNIKIYSNHKILQRLFSKLFRHPKWQVQLSASFSAIKNDKVQLSELFLPIKIIKSNFPHFFRHKKLQSSNFRTFSDIKNDKVQISASFSAIQNDISPTFQAFSDMKNGKVQISKLFPNISE